MKRKLKSLGPVSSKKLKVRHNSTDALPWKSVSRPAVAGIDFDDGILELEEVDNVEVIYEETESGKIARFNVIADDNDSPEEVEEEETEPNAKEESSEDETEPEVFDSETLLPDWHPFGLHSRLLRGLQAENFISPTPIQKASIPFAQQGRDVVGIAQTGSGKTLAYGLPILHHLLTQTKPEGDDKRSLRALILAPTRELALQISSHLNACLKESDKGKEKKGSIKKPPLVSVAAIVGGMSSQKQRRILDRGVDVLVATPGRLWDLLEEDDDLALSIKNLKYLVLDEADRMIETGHFQELENILRLTLRTSDEDHIEGDDLSAKSDEKSASVLVDNMQTFIFSATLSKDLQRNLKARSRHKPKSSKGSKSPASTLDELLSRLDFRDHDPKVIDLSPEHGIVATLKEGKVECLSADKDVFLYYFLLRYPGRSLVFLSSIDGIRRLMPLTQLLNISAFPLHSQLEQRQRLKNLDRFKSTANAVLLATDIAARGLDIPAVDHVIHYQIPRSADVYIHRNGRTARAMETGFSLLMCAPDEKKVMKALLGSLGREDRDISDMDIELSLLDKLKARVQLARQIELSHHKVKKANYEKNWMRETAKAMDIELDSDFVSSDSDGEAKLSKQKRKTQDSKTASLKAQLKTMLAQPLVARGVSTKYITSGSRPIVESLLAEQHNESMLGLRKTEAGSDIVAKRKRSKKGRV